MKDIETLLKATELQWRQGKPGHYATQTNFNEFSLIVDGDDLVIVNEKNVELRAQAFADILKFIEDSSPVKFKNYRRPKIKAAKFIPGMQDYQTAGNYFIRCPITGNHSKITIDDYVVIDEIGHIYPSPTKSFEAFWIEDEQ